jgi:hypothetical protein
VSPLPWLEVAVHGGALVRQTSFAGSSAFEPTGAIRRDRTDLAPDRAPFIAPPTTTWALGAEAGVGRAEIARVSVGVREMFEDDGLVARRVAAAALSQPIDALRLRARSVFDLLDGAPVELGGEVLLTPIETWRLGARIEHDRPRFDPGTVWAYFDLAPMTEIAATVAHDLSGRATLRGGLTHRIADFGDDTERDTGLDGALSLRVAGFDFEAEAFVWGGSLGPTAAVLFSAARQFGPHLELDFRVSVWSFDDPLRAGIHGTSVSDALGGRVRFSESTSVRADLQHAYSRVVGHRLRALLALSIEVWR